MEVLSDSPGFVPFQSHNLFVALRDQNRIMKKPLVIVHKAEIVLADFGSPFLFDEINGGLHDFS